MRSRARLAVVVLVAVAALRGALAAPDDARLPVPDAAARAPVAAQIRKDNAADLKSKDVEVKRKLAHTFLDRAADAKADAVQRYVLFEQAGAVAEDVKDVRLAIDVAHGLGEAFQVVAAAKAFASVDAITKAAKEPALLAEGANACVELAGEAIADNDPGTAGNAVAAAKKLASGAKLDGLAARAAELVAFVASFRRMSTAADAAGAALAATPDDPAANEAVGRFLAFGRGDWDSGLAHLTKSADSALKDVATRDLAHPADVAERGAVADAWWALAQKEKDPLAKARMLARAAAVYDATPDDAPQDRRTLAKTRLDSLTWFAWARGVALTKDFSKSGPAQLALAAIRAFIAEKHIDHTTDGWRLKVPHFPEKTFDRGADYVWTLDTNRGVIAMRLFTDTAPLHAANFIYLTELGYYDGLLFHRVIPGFMAQGGAVNKDGTGGPAFGFDGEFGGDRKVDKAGLLCMANTGQPKSDAAQFFITFAAAEHLNGKHTVCGEVISGMDVVKKLEKDGSESGATKNTLIINSAKISVR
jgi:peptidyl-prolyl cis-trans isomerase B (cyclophilin B)